jgi:hypothetical protein
MKRLPVGGRARRAEPMTQDINMLQNRKAPLAQHHPSQLYLHFSPFQPYFKFHPTMLNQPLTVVHFRNRPEGRLLNPDRFPAYKKFHISQ